MSLIEQITRLQSKRLELWNNRDSDSNYRRIQLDMIDMQLKELWHQRRVEKCQGNTPGKATNKGPYSNKSPRNA